MATLCVPLAHCHSVGPPYGERVVFDKDGKIIVPFTNSGYISYLGSGLYEVTDGRSGPPSLYDYRGRKISCKLPPGGQLVRAVKEPNRPEDLEHPTKNFLIYFSLNDKQGVCDFDGNVLSAARYKSLGQYLGDGVVLAHNDDLSEDFIIKFDGTVIGHLNPHNDPDSFHPVMMGATMYSEGRRAVDHHFGMPCALMDLSCKVITPEKFAIVGGFKNGKSVARLITADGANTVLIDREGNTIKQFPKNWDLEWLCHHFLYVYRVIDGSKKVAGLLDQNGDVIIPAQFNSLELVSDKYYVGRIPDKEDEISIFDLSGKLLFRTIHEIRTSTLKHPEVPGDLSVRLSTLTQFLCSRDAHVAQETISFKDGSSACGLISESGKWIIDPIYLDQQRAVYSEGERPTGQFAFELRPKNFSKDGWLRGAHFTIVQRGTWFNLFLKDYNLIGMPVAKVKDLLGQPDEEDKNTLSYVSFTEQSGQQVTSIQMKLDANHCVAAWRNSFHSDGKLGQPTSYDSAWEARNMTPSSSPSNYGTLVPKEAQSAP